MILGELVKIRESLNNIQNLTKVKLRTSYNILKFMNESENDFQFYANHLQNIINEYGARDEDGKLKIENESILVQEDKVKECQNKVDELENIEVNEYKLKIFLEDLDNTYLDRNTLAVLMPYIIFED